MLDNTAPPVVLILVDGLGFDQVSESKTPFLAGFARKGALKPLRPVLGYSDAQRVALLTGKAPDEAGYWMQYRFCDAGQSPWRMLSVLSPIDRAPGDFLRRNFKFALSATLMKAVARRSRYSDLNIHNMPFRALRWHRPTLPASELSGSEIAGTPTLFSLLRRAGRRYAIVKTDSLWALLRTTSVSKLLPGVLGRIAKTPGGTALLYVYVHTPDLYAHRFGLKDCRFDAEVSRVDSALGEIVTAARQRLGSETQTVAVSDHGMDHTGRFIDFNDLVMHPRFGKDFIAGIDSTMVRLYYLNQDGRRVARTLVETSGAGTFLTPEQRGGLGVNFPAEAYGEDIYLLKPGISIYPNFHSLLRPLAMHAYHPETPDQQAFTVYEGESLASLRAHRGTLRMQDIFAAVRAALRLS
jgi:predicted AlkP superfamily pyrophosphatase or phosphodiesterase